MPILNVPYKSQRDNEFNPSGSCNVTSVAMCLAYFGIKGDGSYPQLEDQLYAYCNNNGLSRHDPLDLAYMVNTLYKGIVKDTFTAKGTIQDIKDAIDAKCPCILHGYFTRSGHIIVAKGYTDGYIVVNDSWGEYFAHGYDTSVSGENLPYSEKLIAETCSPESVENPSDIYLHVISRV